MKPVHALPLTAAAIVGSLSCSQGAHWKLELSSSTGSVSDGQAADIEMQAKETTIVELVVVGAASGPVEFSASELPAFGTLQGPMLRFSPGREDAGEYDVTVTATAGGESQVAALHLVVHRFNSPPTAGTAWIIFYDDAHGFRDIYCPGQFCTADGTAKLEFWPCDAEGDGMTIDVEVVRRGAPFTKVPTHSASIPRRDAYVTNPEPKYCQGALVALTGLVAEQSYNFAFRISDEFGAVMKVPGAPDGWNRNEWFGFEQGPCTTQQCACVPSGPAFCGYGKDYVCCSGVCTGDAFSGYRCL